jgi:hypothetical protein
MSKNHLLDFKNLENHTSQHDAVKTDDMTKSMTAYYFFIFLIPGGKICQDYLDEQRP